MLTVSRKGTIAVCAGNTVFVVRFIIFLPGVSKVLTLALMALNVKQLQGLWAISLSWLRYNKPMLGHV